MRHLEWREIMAVVLLGAIAASVGWAQDSPQWRGLNREGKVAGFTAPATWPTTLTQGWRVTVGQGDAPPALVGDRLYVFTRQADKEVTLCLNAADGAQVWRDEYVAPAVTGPAGSHPGPRSAPAVAASKVVTLGVTGILSCLDAATGALVWRKDPFPGVFPQFYTSSSPLITDGMAIAQLGGQAAGGVLAFDLASGEEKWRWAGEGPEYSSPVLMTVEGVKQVVAMTGKSVAGIAVADGKLLWQIPFAPAGRMAYNAATPIVSGTTVIYTGSGRGTAAAKIEKQGEAFVATPLWSNPQVAVQFNSPVLHENLLFGLSANGNFFCVNALTGQTSWVDTVARGPRGFAAIVDAGAVLLALPNTGEMLVMTPSDQAYTEVAKIKVAETATYAGPVVAGNRIFVKDQESLTLWTIPQG